MNFTLNFTARIAALCAAFLLFALPAAAQKTYEPQVGQAGKDVIWVPTPDEVVDRMLRMAQVGPSDLVFDPVATVRYISTILTLVPGDVVSTGTPGGVGVGRQPPVFLAPGQQIRTVIEGIGELLNECVAEDRSPS